MELKVNEILEAPCSGGCNNVVIGVGSNSTHDNCIIIGTELTSDYDYQVKVGNSVYNKSREMTVDEFKDLYGAICDIISWAPNGG